MLDQNNNNTYEVFGIAGSDLIYGLTDASINASKQAIYKDNLSSKTRLYTNSFENTFQCSYPCPFRHMHPWAEWRVRLCCTPCS